MSSPIDALDMAGPERHGNRLAIAFMLAASALVAATSLIAKSLGQGPAALHPMQISAGRFAFALLALSLFLTARPRLRPSLSGARWRWHILRSVCGWLGVTAMFAAVARMPVAEATAISFLSPLVTMGLAAMVLSEQIGPRKLLATALAITGAALILRPGSEAFRPAGLIALLAALFMGAEAIFIKRLSDTEPPLRVLVINNSIGAVISAVAASFVWIGPAPVQWLLLITLGTVMVCGQACFIQSMKRGQASMVIPVFYSVLLFATLYDLLLYNVAPSAKSIAGASLITAAALTLAYNWEGLSKMSRRQ